MARRDSFQQAVLRYMVAEGWVTSIEIAGRLAAADVHWSLSGRQRLHDLRRKPYHLDLVCMEYRTPTGALGHRYTLSLGERLRAAGFVAWRSDGERHIMEWSLGRMLQEEKARRRDREVAEEVVGDQS